MNKPIEKNTKIWLKESRFGLIFSGLMLFLVWWPVQENWHQPPVDNFPLSYYPMFSFERKEFAHVTHPIGYTQDQKRITIPLEYIGVGGMNTVRKQLRKIIHLDEEHRKQYCLSILQKINESGDQQLQQIREIRLITGIYYIADYYQGQKLPRSEDLHMKCYRDQT